MKDCVISKPLSWIATGTYEILSHRRSKTWFNDMQKSTTTGIDLRIVTVRGNTIYTYIVSAILPLNNTSDSDTNLYPSEASDQKKLNLLP